MIDTWLRIAAIGMPLIGTLTLWRWKARPLHIQRWLAVIILVIVGLIALSIFLLNQHYACVISPGKQNCLFEGLATLSLFVLSLVVTRSCIILRGENLRQVYILMLLLISAWAGMGLVENLLALLAFLNLFYFVMDRLLRRQEISWHFLVLRDDYKDDFSP